MPKNQSNIVPLPIFSFAAGEGGGERHFRGSRARQRQQIFIFGVGRIKGKVSVLSKKDENDCIIIN